ncbi:MAG TPA: hypothetical protein VJS20_08790 [Gemmatimonadales bacterium]|nr:hypothetical protein [Gemmatimonadales bacterium]
MTDEEMRDYAEALIVDHAIDVRFVTVIECYDEYAWRKCDAEISEEDARKVHDLIHKAKITIEWPS